MDEDISCDVIGCFVEENENGLGGDEGKELIEFGKELMEKGYEKGKIGLSSWKNGI